MPQFMDFHDDLKLPEEAIQQITSDTKDEKADEFGVRQVELFPQSRRQGLLLAGGTKMPMPCGSTTRLSESPCGDVHEVSGIL